MGTKYTTNTVSGYNASPPTDGGAATEENRVTWAKSKTKLTDPLKTTLEAVDAALVTAFDVGPSSRSANYTTVAGDHQKTISVTATGVTITLIDAATATAGYTVNISNQSTGDVTVGRATGGDTINGTAANVTIVRGSAMTLRVNTAATGYEIIETGMSDLAGLAKTDSNFIVGDGTKWVAESGATARTSLGLGTAATQDTGTSGATVPLLNGANTWSAGQTFAAITAGTSAGALFFFAAGIASGNATGGDKGAGSINVSAVYDDNVLLTCYAIDAYRNGSVDVAFWDSTALDLDVPAIPEQAENRPVTRKVMRTQRVRDGARIVETLVEVDEPVYDELPVFDAAGKPVKGADGRPLTDRVPRMERAVTAPARPARTEVKTHAPAARFAARAVELLDPKQYGASWKATGHLPAMPSPSAWDASGKKMALGDIQQRLWETVEVQAIHIDKLLARIEALEARVTALGG